MAKKRHALIYQKIVIILLNHYTQKKFKNSSLWSSSELQMFGLCSLWFFFVVGSNVGSEIGKIIAEVMINNI